MGFRIEISSAAERDLKKIPRKDLSAVVAAIDALEDDPRHTGARKLSGLSDIYRVRAGDWRIIYRIEDEKVRVLVLRVGNRREVYRKLERMQME